MARKLAYWYSVLGSALTPVCRVIQLRRSVSLFGCAFIILQLCYETGYLVLLRFFVLVSGPTKPYLVK